MPGLEDLFDFGDWEPPELPGLDDLEFPFEGWPTIDEEGDLIDDPDWPLSPEEYSWGNWPTPSPPELPPPAPEPPAVGPAVVTAATWVAIGVLAVELVSLTHCYVDIQDKDELQQQADNLNKIRDRAVKLGQWNDDLQRDWTKASQTLSERAEQLQRDLENTWIGKLFF